MNSESDLDLSRPLECDVAIAGVDRIVWGSNYPHADATFPGYLEKLAEALAPLSADDRERVLHRNAASRYCLD